VNPSKRRVVVTASERFSPNTIVGDPIANGATLQVTVKGGTTTTQTFLLPPGSPPTSTGPGWTGSNTGSDGKYTYIDKNGEASPVTKLMLAYKAGSRFKIKALVDAQGNNGAVNVLPGNPTIELGIIITIGSGDSYCVLFGGAAGGDIREDPGKFVRAVQPTAEGCPLPSPGCGDGIHALGEECDGPDDSACPGACGAANGFFPCLCQDIPRQRVVEHANADLDHGWTGRHCMRRRPELHSAAASALLAGAKRHGGSRQCRLDVPRRRQLLPKDRGGFDRSSLRDRIQAALPE
jgi:hypothetical protein